MKIEILAIGEQMPEWVQTACQMYQKRLSAYCQLTVKSLPLAKRFKGARAQQMIDHDTRTLVKALPKGSHVIALDQRGKHLTTEALASRLEALQHTAPHCSLLIGGPDGMDLTQLPAPVETWSLSSLTLPHPLVRIILIEQLYRAMSFLNHHPYHRST